MGSFPCFSPSPTSSPAIAFTLGSSSSSSSSSHSSIQANGWRRLGPWSLGRRGRVSGWPGRIYTSPGGCEWSSRGPRGAIRWIDAVTKSRSHVMQFGAEVLAWLSLSIPPLTFCLSPSSPQALAYTLPHPLVYLSLLVSIFAYLSRF